ncbi:MAG: N-acetylmuramoyl-L-alanine amidase [Bacteroidia bacterium]
MSISYKPIIILLILCVSNCFAQDTALAFRINKLNQKLNNYLIKHPSLADYYSIDEKGISIYDSRESKLNKKAEFYIEHKNCDGFKQAIKQCNTDEYKALYKKGSFVDNNTPQQLKAPVAGYQKALSGIKIALDPGHIAGNMEIGDIEKKCLTLKYTNTNGVKDSVAFAEGMLTFATAQLLKNKLEAEGAEVFMTRTFNNGSAFGKSFDDWLKTDYKKTVDSLADVGKISEKQKQFFYSSKASKRDKFRVIFKDLELAKRAEIINNFKPDFTVIIHYNVDEHNTGWVKPTKKNYNMVFVGGAFMNNDLSSIEKRSEFLRLLVTDDIEQSVAISDEVVKSFERQLNVKTATVKDADYLNEGCLTTEKTGVYCRNLQLTRYVHGPLVYGETLYQDNENECVLLNQETDKTKNKRVQEVAEAYYIGIVNYIKKTK